MRLLVILLLVVSASSSAQIITDSSSVLKFKYDNDYFSETDRYYTQGARLEYNDAFVKRSPLTNVLLSLGNHTIERYGIAIERDGYTPRSIRRDSIYYGERPFAAVMFISHFKYSSDRINNEILFTQFDVGIIGPAVGGYEEQTSIHRAIGNILPQGWRYQIRNDVVLNYTARFEKGVYQSEYLEFIGWTEARAGTLFDDLSTGAQVRVGWMNPYFSFFKKRKNNIQCYLTAKVSGRLIAFNATMQGGMFNKSSVYKLSSEDIARSTGITSSGIVVSYKGVGLEYGKVWITPEFKGGLPHGWGHCVLTFNL